MRKIFTACAKIMLFYAMATLSIQWANAASFDCNRAVTWVEKTICNNAELSDLDEQLASKYKQDIASSDGNEPYVRAGQKQWLIYQRNTCLTADCLIREYTERLTNKISYGVAWDYANDLSATDLPKNQAFGKFSEAVKISMYNPDAANDYEILTDTNTVTIHKIPTKSYLSIIDGGLIFDNAHMCSINDEKALWSQNHWVINNYELEEACELRLYPHNGSLLIKDIDNQCRKLYCGMRGYFDDIVLEK